MRVVFPAPKNPVMIVKGVLASSFAVDCSAMAAACCARAWRSLLELLESVSIEITHRVALALSLRPAL